MADTEQIFDDTAIPEDANHEYCRWSSGIHDCLTVGRGRLDEHGFWERGCPTCARKHETEHPEDGPVWPHKPEDIERMNMGTRPKDAPRRVEKGTEMNKIMGYSVRLHLGGKCHLLPRSLAVQIRDELSEVLEQ